MKNNNYYVGYWNLDSNKEDCFYGSHNQVESFIEETLLNEAEYGIKTIELWDKTPQPNITEENYDLFMRMPINTNLDEYMERPEAVEEIDTDELPF